MISRHRTSEGVLSYVRCVCGRIELRMTPYGSASPIAAVTPAD
ncbi:hypothetical protein [Bailinhaonella thermotolerans]|nr:hypothetical protein [Bailinhaonella thermotolerans]